MTTDDGVELAVEISGSGPGLLLVHGHGGAKEDFADHVERLARQHTVVTFDHRGHGRSGHPTDPAAYSLARMRADTWAVADAVGLERFRVLGHSMGGMVVRRMPLEQPKRNDAQVMMDTCAGPTSSPARKRPSLARIDERKASASEAWPKASWARPLASA